MVPQDAHVQAGPGAPLPDLWPRRAPDGPPLPMGGEHHRLREPQALLPLPALHRLRVLPHERRPAQAAVVGFPAAQHRGLRPGVDGRHAPAVLVPGPALPLPLLAPRAEHDDHRVLREEAGESLPEQWRSILKQVRHWALPEHRISAWGESLHMASAHRWPAWRWAAISRASEHRRQQLQQGEGNRRADRGRGQLVDNIGGVRADASDARGGQTRPGGCAGAGAGPPREPLGQLRVPEPAGTGRRRTAHGHLLRTPAGAAVAPALHQPCGP
mmetsp:Transcript_96950/g.289614  ORF Transcript_96950/g.289614 Transcript_96950/m.289614 type:complete len:271 (-) Transcript_96950:166-978(-)